MPTLFQMSRVIINATYQRESAISITITAKSNGFFLVFVASYILIKSFFTCLVVGVNNAICL
jgi:hypothetical protein